MIKVVFVNTKKKYLFIKEYDSYSPLLKLLIRIYHSTNTPILPISISGLPSGYDPMVYRIRYYYDNLGFKIIPNINEYSSYPLYHKKDKNKNK